MTAHDHASATLHPASRPSLRRPIGGTLALGALGALVGLAVGTALLLRWTGSRPVTLPDLSIAMRHGGAVGAIMGAITAPVMAWGVMRPVPLGRAIGWSAVGTVLGALVPFVDPMLGGLLGFLGGSLAARLRTDQLARRAAAPGALPTR